MKTRVDRVLLSCEFLAGEVGKQLVDLLTSDSRGNELAIGGIQYTSIAGIRNMPAAGLGTKMSTAGESISTLVNMKQQLFIGSANLPTTNMSSHRTLSIHVANL